jgi:hypothetical protein
MLGVGHFDDTEGLGAKNSHTLKRLETLSTGSQLLNFV